MRILPALALLLAVTACGTRAGSGERSCTLVAALGGISVEVEPVLASRVNGATLVACWDGSCHTSPVMLEPSTAAGPTTCTGDRPEDVCSAEVRPTGGKIGSSYLPELPLAPVRVTLTLTGDGGATILEHTLAVTAEPSYPNGPDCGAGPPGEGLLVTADGTVRERD